MKISNRFIFHSVASCMLICTSFSALAQRYSENVMSAYFANKMLLNPALAAADGNKFYVLQNRSWLGFDGAPVLTNVTGELAFGRNSAVGISFMSDKAGVLRRSYGLVNYSYKVKFSDVENLRVGASFAFNRERLDFSGATNDPVINNNVSASNEFDGNFGLNYQRKTLNLGVTVNRIGNNLNAKGKDANLSLLTLTGRYGMTAKSDDKLYFEPLALLRVYRVTAAVADVGLLFRYNNLLNIMAVYQTTGNVRTGLGVALKNIGEANIYYNTNLEMDNSNSQQYEIGLGIYFLQKKK